MVDLERLEQTAESTWLLSKRNLAHDTRDDIVAQLHLLTNLLISFCDRLPSNLLTTLVVCLQSVC